MKNFLSGILALAMVVSGASFSIADTLPSDSVSADNSIVSDSAVAYSDTDMIYAVENSNSIINTGIEDFFNVKTLSTDVYRNEGDNSDQYGYPATAYTADIIITEKKIGAFKEGSRIIIELDSEISDKAKYWVGIHDSNVIVSTNSGMTLKSITKNGEIFIEEVTESANEPAVITISDIQVITVPDKTPLGEYSVNIMYFTEDLEKAELILSVPGYINVKDSEITESSSEYTTESKSETTTQAATVTELSSETTTQMTTVIESFSESTTQVTTVTELSTEFTTQVITVTEISSETTTQATTVAESSTESTTETASETTTYRSSGGGGGGSSSVKTTTTTTTESTTELTTETATEITTESATEVTTESAVSFDIKMTIGENSVKIGNSTYVMDASAYIQTSSNSTMVPLRFVALSILGADVDNVDNSNIIGWDAYTKTATITVDNRSISFTEGSDKMIVDGTSTTMENGVNAEIKDGRMYIPFRALGNALGVQVDWDAETKTAIYKTH